MSLVCNYSKTKNSDPFFVSDQNEFKEKQRETDRE